MSWRTVVIIEDPAVALTGCLLSELMERRIKVIFCDRKHMPQGELVPYYGSHDTSRKLRIQMAWQEPVMGVIWSRIIGEKIRQQALLLRDLYGQMEGVPGKLVLSENGTILPVGRWVELVDNCIHFELDRKPLLNKVCAAMERTAMAEEAFLETTELLARLELYVDRLAFELPGDIVCEKCTVPGLLKGLGIRFRDEYEDPLERLVDFMELVREYDRDKLFVLVGLRGLFGDEEVARFLKTVLDHGYRVLLMDTVSRERLPNEKRLTIDNDLCEF